MGTKSPSRRRCRGTGPAGGLGNARARGWRHTGRRHDGALPRGAHGSGRKPTDSSLTHGSRAFVHVVTGTCNGPVRTHRSCHCASSSSWTVACARTALPSTQDRSRPPPPRRRCRHPRRWRKPRPGPAPAAALSATSLWESPPSTCVIASGPVLDGFAAGCVQNAYVCARAPPPPTLRVGLATRARARLAAVVHHHGWAGRPGGFVLPCSRAFTEATWDVALPAPYRFMLACLDRILARPPTRMELSNDASRWPCVGTAGVGRCLGSGLP